jgi:hypothetical protein
MHIVVFCGIRLFGKRVHRRATETLIIEAVSFSKSVGNHTLDYAVL